MYGRKYTLEEKRFIKKNVRGRSCAELTALFNRHFGASVTVGQMKSFMGNHKLHNGQNGRFRPGQIPFNKGRKGITQGEIETQFKPGNQPWNYLPPGSEQINTDGYAEVKIADPHIWKGKHLLVWEKANDPVPKGHAVIFADGTKAGKIIADIRIKTADLKRGMEKRKSWKTVKGNKESPEQAPGYLRFLLEIFAYVGEQIPHTPSFPQQVAGY
jgi:hypothetical protein